jgi:hypothetical protein
VSLTPEIKMGVLLQRSPAERLALATWALLVVPTGMPLIGPDTSDDVRRCAASCETAGSDESEPLAVGMSSPPGFCVATVAAVTAAYVATPSGDTRCRPPEAACSPVASPETREELVSRVWRLAAGSGVPSGPAGSVAFLLGGRCDGTGASGPPPAVGTKEGIESPLPSTATLRASTKAGLSCKERKAECSALRIVPAPFQTTVECV